MKYYTATRRIWLVLFCIIIIQPVDMWITLEYAFHDIYIMCDICPISMIRLPLQRVPKRMARAIAHRPSRPTINTGSMYDASQAANNHRLE
jgi:hypothetical protein